MKLLPGPLRRRRDAEQEESRKRGEENGWGPSGLTTEADEAAKKREKEADRQRLKKSAAEIPIQALGYVDERTGAGPFLRGFLYRKVPRGTNWFYTLGSATMFAFISQAVT